MKRTTLVFIGTLLLAGVICFWRLGDYPMQKWDEGIHGSVSVEFDQSRDWALTYHDQPYFAKPPLRFWLTWPVVKLFGETEFAMRFWSAVAGVLTALLLCWWGMRATNNAWVGGAAAAIFLFGRFLFFHSFRTGETDGMLVLLVTAAMYAYWRWWEDRKWWVWFGLAVGLIFLTKPMFGIFPLAIAGLDVVLGRSLNRQRFLDLLCATLVAVVLAAPWHIAMSIRFGTTFWDAFVGFNVLQRAGDTLYKNYVPWWWYAKVIGMRFYPFVVLLPLALLTIARDSFAKGRSLARLLIVWTLVIFLAFTLVKTKFDWYVLPLYPALAMLIALAMKQWWQRRRRWMVYGLIVILGIVWALAVRELDLGGPIRFLTPFGYVPDQFRSEALAVAIAVLVSFLLMRNYQRWIVPIGLFSMSIIFALGGWWTLSELKHLPSTSPTKELVATLVRNNIKTVDIVHLDLRNFPNLYYYLRRERIEIRPVGLETPNRTAIKPVAASGGGEVFGEFRLVMPIQK